MDLMARALLQLASFIVVGSVLMLLITDPHSGERVVSVFSLSGGLVVAAISILLIRYGRKHKSPQEDQ